MAEIYISLGSNINREDNTRSGVEAMRRVFGQLELSSVYESEAVGFVGDAFFNMVIATITSLDVHDVNHQLRAIEEAHGRDRSGQKFSSRSLDLDLLLYDNLVLDEQGLILPRIEILKNAFVLWPLAEIAPNLCHPVSKQRYAQHWMAFDKTKQHLKPVHFNFQR